MYKFRIETESIIPVTNAFIFRAVDFDEKLSVFCYTPPPFFLFFLNKAQ
jgi:hypothetical protein